MSVTGFDHNARDIDQNAVFNHTFTALFIAGFGGKKSASELHCTEDVPLFKSVLQLRHFTGAANAL